MGAWPPIVSRRLWRILELERLASKRIIRESKPRPYRQLPHCLISAGHWSQTVFRASRSAMALTAILGPVMQAALPQLVAPAVWGNVGGGWLSNAIVRQWRERFESELNASKRAGGDLPIRTDRGNTNPRSRPKEGNNDLGICYDCPWTLMGHIGQNKGSASPFG
jgi:hypothetical protein